MRALEAEAAADGSYVFSVVDGWQQGRGAFGGLIIGAMVRAATRSVNDPQRKVRSVTAELLGPVLVGECTFHVDKLRQGAGVSAVRVRLVQANEELAQCVIVFAKDRPNTPTWQKQQAFTSAPSSFADVEELAIGPPIAPVFTPHFSFRPVGPFPYSSSADPATSGFIHAREAGDVVDAAVVCCHADAWWPAGTVLFDEMRPCATITFALEICCDLADVEANVPLFHCARADSSHGGYCVEHRQLWTPNGVLVAQNQQVFAIIR